MLILITNILAYTVFKHSPNPFVLLEILGLTIAFLFYIPKRQHDSYSLKKDIIVNSL